MRFIRLRGLLLGSITVFIALPSLGTVQSKAIHSSLNANPKITIITKQIQPGRFTDVANTSFDTNKGNCITVEGGWARESFEAFGQRKTLNPATQTVKLCGNNATTILAIQCQEQGQQALTFIATDDNGNSSRVEPIITCENP